MVPHGFMVVIYQDSPARDSIPTEWTDEKHSLYLKSMEASFVNELYSSFDLLGWRSQREHSSDAKLSGKKHASSRTSSCQVLPQCTLVYGLLLGFCISGCT